MDFEIDLTLPEIRFALETVRLGARLAGLVKSGSAVRSMAKPDHSPVTIADLGIQAIAGALLGRDLPGACLVGEEDSASLRKSENRAVLEEVTACVRSFFKDATADEVCQWIDKGTGVPKTDFWTLDPIDGTKGFLRGGQYVTAVALIKNGKVQLSALGCPELELPGQRELGRGVMTLAARGKGCWVSSLEDGKCWVRLQVSQCRDITQAHILDSFDPGHKNTEKNAFIKKTLGIRPDPVVMDSQAKHVVVAAGGAEIFFRTIPKRDPLFREKIWDVAAGAFAIEEAGGRVTDLEGKPMDYGAGITLGRNPGFVATNGYLHDAVLAILREVTV